MGTGIGQMAGPGLGGALYEIGGYSFPFYVMGLMCAISMIPVYYLIEGDCKPCPIEEKVERTKLWDTFKVQGVYVNLIASAVVCTILGFNEVTLDLHVREVSSAGSPQFLNALNGTHPGTLPGRLATTAQLNLDLSS